MHHSFIHYYIFGNRLCKHQLLGVFPIAHPRSIVDLSYNLLFFNWTYDFIKSMLCLKILCCQNHHISLNIFPWLFFLTKSNCTNVQSTAHRVQNRLQSTSVQNRLLSTSVQDSGLIQVYAKISWLVVVGLTWTHKLQSIQWGCGNVG